MSNNQDLVLFWNIELKSLSGEIDHETSRVGPNLFTLPSHAAVAEWPRALLFDN